VPKTYAISDGRERQWWCSCHTSSVRLSLVLRKRRRHFASVDVEGQLPASAHPPQRGQSFNILEGEITAWIGDQTIRGTPGTLIFGPRGVRSFEIHSDQVRMLILLTPAGLEGYLKQFCMPAPR
jgi:mannose-6-phosphate isomerase-like protein (cupin superfamily)